MSSGFSSFCATSEEDTRVIASKIFGRCKRLGKVGVGWVGLGYCSRWEEMCNVHSKCKESRVVFRLASEVRVGADQ